MLHVDDSAKALRMRISDHKVLDGSLHDILSPDSGAWRVSSNGKRADPRALLVLPEAAK